MWVYFGTYTDGDDGGVFHGKLDLETGQLTVAGASGGVTNPSFLALAPSGRFLYCAAEGGGGAVAAFAIAPDTGELTLLNTQPSGGGAACHVTLDPAGTTAIVSNYSGGSVASFPIQDDGTLGEAASLIQHQGSSVAKRQQSPHAHSTNIDAAGRFAVTADLGLDQLLVYALDAETSRLRPHDPAALDLHPGAGPRHFAFAPHSPFAYVINELDSTVTAMRWDAEAGTLTTLQTLSTLPEGYDGRNDPAEVVVHPNGRFLYGSNRGHDSLVIYAIDAETGRLTLVGFQPVLGQEPRGFSLDPTGRWLIACHQNSDSVQVFSVDGETGLLTAVGEAVAVPKPVCVKFLAR